MIDRGIDSFLIRDYFPKEQLMQLYDIALWFANIVNYLVVAVFLPRASRAQIDKLKSDAKHYVWDALYLWKFYNDQVIHKCIPDHKMQSVLHFCHASPNWRTLWVI
ncbi:hypothetical protein Fmac_015019 [Flemingia macrophylla]|uniref:Uncharacterized protein n=1 Tax=Flemingia macrophylla TaxID=520843 RepID=A0ABD1MDE7_9FABA